MARCCPPPPLRARAVLGGRALARSGARPTFPPYHGSLIIAPWFRTYHPRCAADLTAYYGDRSSWSVALDTAGNQAGNQAGDQAGEQVRAQAARAGTLRASFRRLEPVLQVRVS